MGKVTYRDSSGRAVTVEVEDGTTLMEAALQNAVPGVIGECGGSCACATCHVYVDESWLAQLSARGEEEEGMLDFAFDVRANSRLSCQIRMREDLDGLSVTVADRQK
ncbi:MAG: 2Fe-2S iron-sulfur cluster-binding protein [Steroidobacteraceae bacterium]